MRLNSEATVVEYDESTPIAEAPVSEDSQSVLGRGPPAEDEPEDVEEYVDGGEESGLRRGRFWKREGV